MTKNWMNTTLTSTMRTTHNDDNNPRAKGISLEEFLQARAVSRQERNKTTIVDFFPDYHDLRERIYIGVLSWTLLDRRERWLRPSAVVNIGYGLQTGAEIARDYLDWKYPAKLRATAHQRDLIKMHRAAPLYVQPAVLENGAYVDLKSAYWSVMSLVGWDVDYFPSKWIGQGTIPNDFPLADHKVARNSLVSCGLPTPVRLWTGYQLVKQYRRNWHINMGLWALIMDVLHAVASIARKYGAVYVHTDGYILQSWDAPALIEEIEAFGLHASIKASGVSSVIGMGNYMVGSKMTKAYGHTSSVMGGVDTIYQTPTEQIREKLKHLSNNQQIVARRQEFSRVRE